MTMLMTSTPDETTVAIPAEIRSEIDAASAYVAGLVPSVKNDAQLQDAAIVLRDISTKAKDLEKRRLDITRPMDAAKKSVMDLFAAPLNALQSAERAIKAEIARYQREQEAIRAEQQRKLNEAAERERLERERIAEEHRRKAAEAETEAQRTRYEALAEAQEQKAVNIAPPVLAGPAKVEGVSLRETWSAEVTDLMELVKFVAANEHMIGLLVPDMVALNGMARSLKEGFRIPGVKAVKTSGVAARRI